MITLFYGVTHSDNQIITQENHKANQSKYKTGTEPVFCFCTVIFPLNSAVPSVWSEYIIVQLFFGLDGMITYSDEKKDW